jgi:hypothetical protein
MAAKKAKYTCQNLFDKVLVQLGASSLAVTAYLAQLFKVLR